VKAEIDGDEPTSALSAEDDTNLCPLPGTAVCGWSKHLIFEVPADDGEQGPLDVKVSYQLRIATSLGDHDLPTRTTVDASEEVKLWED
jgi:hypothetical protein